MNLFKRQGSWIITSSLIVLAIIYLAFIWLPSHRNLRQLQGQVESKRLFLAQATGMSGKVADMQQELDRTEAVTTAWEKSSPHKKDISTLYGKINALAKDAGLVVTRFDPQPIIEHESIQEIPVSILCSGMFSQLYDFLRDIEGVPAPIRVSYVKMERMAMNTKGVQCELSLVIYSDNPKSSDYAKHID
jgi:Tfp pilus assembly protein PilO